ncbi:hypothetical protein CVIRNUC_008092 [Coccomyxa viridis]|uniref:NAD(P)-binding domain-containing protein n=1 Tax=Coccomyxa viridis TaxID=1274662 RepID=A0AAV1IFD3_9CHLO|nr:hypothetical protein CVIRNUC_008092 [Coccomyxa viridis]
MAQASLLSPLPAYAPIEAFGVVARQTASKRNHTISKAIRCTKVSSDESHAEAWDKVAPGSVDLGRRDVFLSTATLTAALLFSNASFNPAAAADIKTVFVAGASGSTGKKVVRELRERGFAVRAGVRDVSKAKAGGVQLDDKVELVEADVTQGADSLAAAMGNADAVISAIGYGGGGDASGYKAVDNEGNKKLVDAALKRKVSKFVLMSSLLTNGKEAGQSLNPGYIFLNLFGNVLNEKLESEKYLRSSGLEWTIVRPGGLKKDPPSEVGNLITSREDTLFGLPTQPGKDISRDTVAAVLVEALRQPGASNKVVEVVASKKEPERPAAEWFKDL